MNRTPMLALVAALAAVRLTAAADDPARPVAGHGWQALFDGKSLDGWKAADFHDQAHITVANGELHIGRGEPAAGIVKDGEPPARMDYEIELEAMRTEGGDFFCGLTFPVNQDPCTLICGGWGGKLVGLSSIDGLDASENQTASIREFKEKTWYKIRLRVTKTHITVWLDDEQVIEQELAEHRISIRREVRPCVPLGISTWKTGAAIRNIRLRKLPGAGGEPFAIMLDSATPGRVFEGIGAVSAGASTRLLPDYPEPQRGQILDFLFKPKFGAGFQHLKVEIGSGENSTCGSEPSHAITRAELADPKPRGYEFWLMAEARKRNPNIILDCLPWAYPDWVGNRFSPASADWFAAFLQVARKNFGLELDWIAAAQNEMGTDLNWIRKDLRPSLDAHGFPKVKLQAPDNNGEHWQIFNTLEKDPELDHLISAVGYHYLDGRDPWEIDQKKGPAATDQAKQSGKPLWASEEWSQSGGQWGDKGALYLARLMNKIYTRDRVTKFEIWCPIDSIYDQIIWPDTGAMQADTPWCGHYTVWPAVWALAHTTQFAEPGWIYLDGACGRIDPDTWRGSHVALRDPKTGDWSLIIVTGGKRTLQLAVSPGLKTGPVHVWKSTAADQFIEQPVLALSNNKAELELEADAIYTLTSTTGQQKGSHGTPPPNKPFPFPFEDNFESYHAGDTPRYFSDQKGSFEVCASPKGGLCLAQIVPAQGIMWFATELLKPHTLFGDVNWQDCVIEADVSLAGGDVEIGGRYADRAKLGYRWILTHDGRWQLNWQFTCLASGRIEGFKPADWHHLRLELNGDRIVGSVDGKPLAAVTDHSGAKGMAFLASTYNHNLFDNVRVGPLPKQP